MDHPTNRRKALRGKADIYWEEARDLYIRSYSRGKINQRGLRAAIVKANRAMLFNPRDYDATLLLGDIFSDLEDANSCGRAFDYYDRAISLRPDLPDAYENKARLLLQLDRPQDALPLARKAVSIALTHGYDPEYLDLTYSPLIEALIKQQEFSEARAAIRAATEKCASRRTAPAAKTFLEWILAEENKGGGNRPDTRIPRRTSD
jgi:tetratricopeptide (TPR) repeat protein